MAEVTITLRLDNGMAVQASGTVGDILVCDMATTLSSILFDASATYSGSNVNTPPPA